MNQLPSRYLYIFLFFVFTFHGFAQRIEWQHEFGSDYTTGAWSLNYAQQRLFMSGSYSNTVDFDPNSNSYDKTSLYSVGYIITYDTSAKPLSFAQEDPYTQGVSDKIIAQDVDPNGTVLAASESEIYLKNQAIVTIRYDSARIEQVAFDNQGNFYALGIFYGRTDMDPSANSSYIYPSIKVKAPPGSTTTNSSVDIFLAKYDPAGSLLFVKTFDMKEELIIKKTDPGYFYNTNTAKDIVVDSENNVILFTGYRFNIDADPNKGVIRYSTNGTENGAMLVKLDPNGNHLWSKNYTNDTRSFSVMGLACDKMTNSIFLLRDGEDSYLESCQKTATSKGAWL